MDAVIADVIDTLMLEADITESFMTVAPYCKLKDVKVQPNLTVDPVCLLKYKDKVKSHICVRIMTKVIKWEDGMVWIVKITFRKKKAHGLKLLPREDMEVDLQHLLLIKPAKTEDN